MSTLPRPRPGDRVEVELGAGRIRGGVVVAVSWNPGLPAHIDVRLDDPEFGGRPVKFLDRHVRVIPPTARPAPRLVARDGMTLP